MGFSHCSDVTTPRPSAVTKVCCAEADLAGSPLRPDPNKISAATTPVDSQSPSSFRPREQGVS
jgi:hypothetical protein